MSNRNTVTLEQKNNSNTQPIDAVSPPTIAKPRVVRSCFIVNEIYLDLPISRVDKVFEANEAACKYASEMNELAERLHQNIEYRVLEAEIVPA
jgi:hypothetical protein